MPASELLEETNPEQGQKPRQIASWTHLVGFLLIGAGVVALGSLAQHAPAGGGGQPRPARQPQQSHSHLPDRSPYGLGASLLLLGRRPSRWRQSEDTLRRALELMEERCGGPGDCSAVLGLWEGSAYGVHWLLSGVPGAAALSPSIVYCRKACLRSLFGWELPSPRAFARRWPFAGIYSGSFKR